MANDQSRPFNIDEDDFETFIQNLREALSQSTSHGIRMLMPPSGPLSWMDVRLIAGDHIIILRIEQSTMYVRGYMRDGDTRFWEFSDTSLIPNSRRLEYSGGYQKADGVVRRARVERKDLPVGYYPLHDAIRDLAGIEDPNSDQVRSARPLLTIIQMIAEAVRINPIVAHIAEHWQNARPMTSHMVDLQNAWRKCSRAVQSADTIWTSHTPLPAVPKANKNGIWTVGHAVAAFAILLCYEITRRRVRRAVTQSSHAVTLPSLICTLVSIEYVRVNDIDGESPGELYGTVMVEDCWGSHVIYDRSSGDHESKGPGDYASLTGPSVAISGEDAFTISVNLWDHDIFSPDDEIAKGDIVWDPRSDSSYDTPLSAEVSGKYGSVTVGYSVISEALSATVSVKIIGQGVPDTVNVYGTIKASSQFQSSTTLFDKSKNEYVEVLPQAHIPLARAVVPAPVNSLSIITVDLWDNASFSDNQIAKGSVQFTPNVGTQDMNISAGKYGQVNVSMTCG